MGAIKTVLVDLSADLLFRNAKQIQQQRNLSTDDMEIVLEKVLNKIREEKQTEYANIILDLSYQVQEKDKMLKELQTPKEVEEPAEKEE